MIVLATLFLLSGFLAIAASAGSGSNGGSSGGTPAYTYAIVQFAPAPVSDYTGGIAGLAATKPLHGHKLDLASAATVQYEAYLSTVHANYRAWLKSNAPWAQIVREFSITFDGFAIALNGNSMSSLQNGPGVASVTQSWLYQPLMDVSVPLIQADKVWAEIVPGASTTQDLFTGLYANLKDVKVAVIDSGILDSHPFIGSCRGSNPVQHFGPYFSGQGLTGIPIVNTHGTHVAGTIGGCLMTSAPTLEDGSTLPFATSSSSLGYLAGVAPGVTLYDFNVFPGEGVGFYFKDGTAFSHDIMAAVEDAVLQGVDVISMSIGGGVQGPNDLLAQAINDAVDAGVVAVIAAGNAGPNPMTVESPGTAANAITVAAASDPHFAGIAVSPDSKGPYGGIIGDFGKFTAPISASYAKTGTTNNQACSAISADFTGMVAVINRGTCSFSTKISNAQKAHAIAVVMINSVPGDPIIMGQDGTPNQPTLPAAMVTKADGTNFAASGTITIGTTEAEYVTSYADILASFSSRGPTPFNFLLKPDVTAPGENVLSSVFVLKVVNGQPEYTDAFAFFQGTSMATPHVSGTAALLLAQHPDWTPAEVKSAIVNNAKRPVLDTSTATNDVSPLSRGGGRVDVLAATSTPIFLNPASLSFGITMGNAPVMGSIPLTFTSAGSAVDCSLSVLKGGTAVTLSATTVSLSAGGSQTVMVSLNAGPGLSLAPGFYTGDVMAVCTSGGVSTMLHAPWLFVVGGSVGFLQGNMISRNPFGDGTSPIEFMAPDGYVAGKWTQ